MEAFKQYLTDNIVVDKLLDNTYTDLVVSEINSQIDDLKQEGAEWIQDKIEDIDDYAHNYGWGAYDVINETVEVGAYACWGDDHAQVWRPDHRGTFPMISFAHGLGDGGEDIHYYDDALHDLASHGYIIIGSQAAGNLYCHDEYKDQLRNIEWAQSDETYSKMINWDIQVGLLGHSMGGESTHRAAGDVEGVKKYNIGAAVAFSPVFYKLQILVPFMFGTGSNDHIVKPMDVEVAYDQSKDKVSAVFNNIEMADHHEFSTGDNRWAPYTASFFDCHLLGSKEDCRNIYGSDTKNPCSLCNCPDQIPLTQCEFSNPPSF